MNYRHQKKNQHVEISAIMSNMVYLLLLDASFNLLGCGFMCSEQIDGAGQVRIQNIPVFISHHQIQI